MPAACAAFPFRLSPFESPARVKNRRWREPNSRPLAGHVQHGAARLAERRAGHGQGVLHVEGDLLPAAGAGLAYMMQQGILCLIANRAVGVQTSILGLFRQGPSNAQNV